MSSDVIAWLVPTASSTPSSRSTLLPANAHLSVPISTTPYLSSSVASSSFLSMPSHALQLTFSAPPKRPGRFVVGTDAQSCDIVLPLLPGVSKQHCSLSFDAEGRLMLEDFSERGTQVWYDWESKGDQTDYTWILSSGNSQGFPSQVKKITIDIQSVRFRILVPSHTPHWHEFRDKVDSFCQIPSWSEGLTSGWDRVSVAPIMPLFAEGPLYHHIYIQTLGDEPVEGFYLWNLAKPWEALVKATA